MKLTGLPARQNGLTLIEIMIALLLGVFLIGGVLGIFVNTRETYRMEEALSRVQENGRFAMEFIGRDLRMAGYSFCPKASSTLPDPLANFLTGVDGNPNGATQDDPDSIAIMWIGGNSCPQTLPGDAINVNYAVVNNAATGLRELQRNGVPLIEGVENMQILYGYDTDETGRGTPEFYGVRGQVTSMARVVSIRVSLLLYSTEQPVPSVLDAPASIVFNNENTVSDRRIRRVFTSTFTLRNRYDIAG
jgi:type IV pilus assembly protein PilW